MKISSTGIRQQEGYTLLEIILALTLVAILAAVCVPAYIRGNRNAEARLCREQISSDLAEVRARAISSCRPAAFILTEGGYELDLGLRERVSRHLADDLILACAGLVEKGEVAAPAAEIVFDASGRCRSALLTLSTPARLWRLWVKEDGHAAWE